MEELSQFFTWLIADKQLDIATLHLDGFQILRNYFFSINEDMGNLFKVADAPKLKAKQTE